MARAEGIPGDENLISHSKSSRCGAFRPSTACLESVTPCRGLDSQDRARERDGCFSNGGTRVASLFANVVAAQRGATDAMGLSGGRSAEVHKNSANPFYQPVASWLTIDRVAGLDWERHKSPIRSFKGTTLGKTADAECSLFRLSTQGSVAHD